MVDLLDVVCPVFFVKFLLLGGIGTVLVFLYCERFLWLLYWLRFLDWDFFSWKWFLLNRHSIHTWVSEFLRWTFFLTLFEVPFWLYSNSCYSKLVFLLINIHNIRYKSNDSFSLLFSGQNFLHLFIQLMLQFFLLGIVCSWGEELIIEHFIEHYILSFIFLFYVYLFFLEKTLDVFVS